MNSMNTTITSNNRLDAWIAAGMLSDEKSMDEYSITNDDLIVLKERLMYAMHQKMLNDPSKMTFAQHDTIQ